MAREKRINIRKHTSTCSICSHPRKADIELDYLHCIPWSTIAKRYPGITDPGIHRHALAIGLNKKRDRKAFYWHLIEQAPMGKMTMENALEASKQLDRIERVIVDNPTPSNIQVVYAFGRPLIGTEPVKADSKDKLPSPVETPEITSVKEEVPAL
jgi:hypothetical protein